GFSAGAREAVKQAIDAAKSSDTLIVQFSHPRLVAQLEGGAPVLCAWGGEAVMQRAAARVLLRELAANNAARGAQAAG
ncbi:MAG TPA: hypothetical protein VLJ83_03540, partial [Gemmatimonadaceae bacterium]|nr:hypothetical protein [Gemmatimonadaceae bacterium]